MTPINKLSDQRGPILVRVAPELLEQIATKDGEPVVIVGIDRQGDGTYDMVLRSVHMEWGRSFHQWYWNNGDPCCVNCGTKASCRASDDNQSHKEASGD